MARYERYIYLFIELVALFVAYLIATQFAFESLEPARRGPLKLLLVCMVLLWTIISLIGAFRPMDRRISRSILLKDILVAWSGFLLGSLVLDYLLGDDHMHRRFIPMLAGLFLVFAAFTRLAIITGIRMYRARGYNFKRIVVVGSNQVSERFLQEIGNHEEYGYRLMGRFRLDDRPVGALELDGFDRFVMENKVDEVYIAAQRLDESVTSIVRFCAMKDIAVSFLSELVDQLNRSDLRMHLDGNGATALIKLDPFKYRNAFDRTAKRSFDLLFSSLVILLLMSWLYPIVAILIKLSSRGPVLFVQQRTGILNRPFGCMKFRSMRMNSDANVKQASKGDPRITRIGAFLRRSNLDEMPQFFNVFLGHMSVVGPRPHMLAHTDQYAELIDPYMERLWLKPGITGLAQAKGYRGETKELYMMERRVEEDRNYIYNWSFMLDLRIVWQTIWNTLTLQKQGF
ncbi:MAG: exopolysaccharide biosynthesis polyprenyl glycosylphosphotransferase [Flavobacteriales bacterium]